jgi:putative SOS response-associated peptidase YedK
VWGLVPNWSRQPGAPDVRPLINARAETAMQKPAFRDAMRVGRVLVPVTAFYEWTGEKGRKQPHVIRVRGEAVDRETGERLGRAAGPGDDTAPFLLAGIAEAWPSPEGEETLSYSILTTEPNELCAPIHDRMPVILDGEDAHAWLAAPAEDTEGLLELLRPFPTERMEEWSVEPYVNDVNRDGPELGQPLLAPDTLF